MIKNFVNNDTCFGCSNCYNICPKQAIQMQYSNGFLNPFVDLTKCVNCGLCVKACPSINKYEKVPFLFDCYAARIKDKDSLFKSTSGGVFTAISNFILEQGGCVCGAVYSDDFKSVFHAITFDKEVRDQMRKAKYVQSNLKDVFKKITGYLNSGKLVLFTGTSCQIHALNIFLDLNKTKKDNLYTIDIVCHGAPSPLIFDNFISNIQQKYGLIEKIEFRSKEFGWHSGAATLIKLKNGGIVPHKEADKYASLYFKNVITRPVCFSCCYTTIFRIGDISIGDCWGIEKTNSLFNDENGTSLLLINNEKGKKIFESIRNNLSLEKHYITDFLQPNLQKPTSKPFNYDLDFLKILNK